MKARLALVLTLSLATDSFAGAERAQWMREARWGVMTHYLFDWITQAEEGNADEAGRAALSREEGARRREERRRSMTVEKWNALVDGFDVEGLANELQSAHVPYYLFTIGQNSGFYVAPNATYDELVG